MCIVVYKCCYIQNHWLLRSAQKGLVDEVKKAIDEGVDVNATDFRINSVSLFNHNLYYFLLIIF